MLGSVCVMQRVPVMVHPEPTRRERRATAASITVCLFKSLNKFIGINLMVIFFILFKYIDRCIVFLKFFNPDSCASPYLKASIQIDENFVFIYFHYQ